MITERKAAEQEKKRLEAQLLQSQKMEAIGNLAGGIAHDFNNILAGVIGFTELLQANLKRGTKAFNYSEQVKKAGLRASELVLQILTFSRQTKTKIKPVNIGIIANEVIKLIRSTLPTTIEIHHDISDNLIVSGNPAQIHQMTMFMNGVLMHC